MHLQSIESSGSFLVYEGFTLRVLISSTLKYGKVKNTLVDPSKIDYIKSYINKEKKEEVSPPSLPIKSLVFTNIY